MCKLNPGLTNSSIRSPNYTSSCWSIIALLVSPQKALAQNALLEDLVTWEKLHPTRQLSWIPKPTKGYVFMTLQALEDQFRSMFPSSSNQTINNSNQWYSRGQIQIDLSGWLMRIVMRQPDVALTHDTTNCWHGYSYRRQDSSFSSLW